MASFAWVFLSLCFAFHAIYTGAAGAGCLRYQSARFVSNRFSGGSFPICMFVYNQLAESNMPVSQRTKYARLGTWSSILACMSRRNHSVGKEELRRKQSTGQQELPLPITFLHFVKTTPLQSLLENIRRQRVVRYTNLFPVSEVKLCTSSSLYTHLAGSSQWI